MYYTGEHGVAWHVMMMMMMNHIMHSPTLLSNKLLTG